MPHEIGKVLVLIGVVSIAVGLFLIFGKDSIPLGRLPGDFHVRREGFQFYFPLTTSLLVSALLSLIMWFIRK